MDSEIICERRGTAGHIVLNRPEALNALTLGIVREMTPALRDWASNPAVTCVVVTAAGNRAFCAGGDIRDLYEQGRAGRYDEALTFFREEYRLNIAVHRFPKPYVSLIDGVVMGGGVGISLHGSHRVAGERYLFAMPEVGIGLFPDVGGTYALPRLPGETGTYLALTGDRVRDADALALGLATHAAPSAALPRIAAALGEGEPVEAVLAAHARDPGPPPLAPERATIDSCFSADGVEAILERLDEAGRRGSPFAERTAATIRTKSPTSLKIALRQVRLGRGLDFPQAMRTEFRIVSRIVRGHDFYEGVRAAVIDKDGAPRWRPARLDEVDEAAVRAYFADLGADELGPS